MKKESKIVGGISKVLDKKTLDKISFVSPLATLNIREKSLPKIYEVYLMVS